MINLTLKLKRLRKCLRVWNWEVFGNIHNRVEILTSQVEKLELNLQQEWKIDLEKDLILTKKRLHQALDDQQLFLDEKAKIGWLLEGDRNTNLFHAAIKHRRSQNSIQLKMDDGSFTTVREVIGSKAVEYFEELFGAFPNPPQATYFRHIKSIIKTEDNEFLSAIPNSEEVWKAVKDMSKTSAPGPDGFTGSFYVSCWKIVGPDVVEAVQLFFKGFGLPKSFSSTVLVLIPKVKHAQSMNQMRPISLCNFCHKIISKILNERVKLFLDRLISPEQFGFISGRSIHQCIALGHDLVSDINNKCHGGNIMLKLDMVKAYDRLSWSFLLHGMRVMGFSEKVCDLIFRNISNCWYSIRWGGKSFGHFKSNRGLRQGDPLSPSLFIIAMECLSCALRVAGQRSGGVKPYWTSAKAHEVNHLLFADDLLIFSNGEKNSFRKLLKVLDAFCLNSGQMLSPEKSKIFFSNHISRQRRDALLQLSGYGEGIFPIRYLGVPLFPGRPNISYFTGLVDKIKNHLAGWMRNFISMGGRVTLIRSVLQSIPIHCLSVLPVPKAILESIEKLLRSFLWDIGSDRRRHWIKWEQVCQPIDTGGLGIRNLHQVMFALHGKLAWNYLTNSSLWATHARSRFVIGRKGSSLWRTISPIITSIAYKCRWQLGRGDTNVATFCANIALEAPKRLQNLPIREVLLDDDNKQYLINQSNPIILDSIDGPLDSDFPDRLIWECDPSGCFSASTFFKNLETIGPKPKYSILWQNWIPVKISCFMWRLLHRALATNDRVRTVGIALASKCVCCSSAAEESIEHIFIHSDLAKQTWQFLCPIFKRRRPQTAYQILYYWGLEPNLDEFIGRLGFGLVCCALWDMWSYRNQLIYGDDHVGRFNIIFQSRRWAQILSTFIKTEVHMNANYFGIFDALHIEAPVYKPHRIQWIPWKPDPAGNTCNIFISQEQDRSRMGAIVRNRLGAFVVAIKVDSKAKSFIRCLFHIIAEITHLGIPFICIQASHSDLSLLSGSIQVKWEDFSIKRKLIRILRNIKVVKISPALNGPASALCFSDCSWRTLCFEALPKTVKGALLLDHTPSPCLFTKHVIRL